MLLLGLPPIVPCRLLDLRGPVMHCRLASDLRKRGESVQPKRCRMGDSRARGLEGRREVEPRAEKLVVRVGGGYNTLREFLDLSARATAGAAHRASIMEMSTFATFKTTKVHMHVHVHSAPWLAGGLGVVSYCSSHAHANVHVHVHVHATT